ncbi:Piso0_000007-like protein [Cordyceps fumosorosea ARSEF 2679]|uniref:Piso0_000007-like protein n=1 Tax=Cordyceps fumosorosea (strain ARSEF 2679) TaxID=1081104 RepID=A0A167CVC0_CORFA|nr:Piso0_000007-like protein [Cordyceps fumosorosea ARSEF 2679]OAA41620.1 Piso0_000007-like protein [Cordyceps fumosorosea ARSEF 2679]
MMMPLRNADTVVLLTAGAAHAHYASMGLDGVSCYIYNGIKGTPDGHMIIRNSNGTWVDHDDAGNHTVNMTSVVTALMRAGG